MPRLTILLVVTLATLAGCKDNGRASSKSSAQPASSATHSAPGAGTVEVVDGKFNVAFVYVGPVGDGGWTYAHDQGRRQLEALVPGVHTAYLESVGEGAQAVQAIRGLARKGFELIITTSFGFMDATEQVAAEFPKTTFVHVSGFKTNHKNFGNLFGAMESMNYLSGMIAGARARADGKMRVGYIAPFPIPEVVRHANALSLGVRETCPGCRVSLRWLFTWFDPAKEKAAAESLLAEGADVIVTGADSTAPLTAAADKGAWGIGYDSQNACAAAPARCLGASYWSWGKIYADLVKRVQAGTYTPGNDYRDVDSGIVGLLGFMEGQKPAPGVPAEVIPKIRATLAAMQKGELSRFDVFAGPIKDSLGRLVVKRGQKLSQEDLEGLKDVPGRADCAVCMSWLHEGIKGELPQR